MKKITKQKRVTSLLSWERGLKYHTGYTEKEVKIVAPLVGAWIEIVGQNAYLANY